MMVRFYIDGYSIIDRSTGDVVFDITPELDSFWDDRSDSSGLHDSILLIDECERLNELDS
jgi:hypothetical protein